jgi:hypothetical protein
MHRLEDRFRSSEQELSIIRRVIEAIPVLLWRTDDSLVLTSLIGWTEHRLQHLNEAIGRPVAEQFAASFGRQAEGQIVELHEAALEGRASDVRLPATGELAGEWMMRAEPVRSASGAVEGVLAVATLTTAPPQVVTRRARAHSTSDIHG